MELVFTLLAVQVVLGTLDNVWHHEITERLATKRAARVEIALHAVRELLYAFVFFALAWWTWHGVWTFVVAGVVLVEIAVTLTDFVVEDATRRLPRTERVLHTVLAINYGAILACLAPILIEWTGRPAGVVAIDYGVWSGLFSAFGLGVLAWGARDALVAAGHFRKPIWRSYRLAPAAKENPRRILITGATGFIGRHLTRRLAGRGDRVIVVSRSPATAEQLFGPHVEIVSDLDALRAWERIDCIINLAGAPITSWLWTKRRKRTLLRSRLRVTRALLRLTSRLTVKPATWINASAIGYYGIRDDDERLHEKSPSGTGFQSRLCEAWEHTAYRAERNGVKVALLRIGLVLGTDGGALPALARPVRFGLGAIIGSGRQWVSWIHIADLIELIVFVLDQRTLSGPINATAPEPATHRDFMRTLATVLERRLLPVRIPAVVLRTGLGQLAELFVAGQRVVPSRARGLDFEFRHQTLDSALTEIFAGQPRTQPLEPHTA